MPKHMIRIVAALTLVAAPLLFVSSPARGDAGCSLETLEGSYAYSADGYSTQTAGQPPFTPIAEAGVYTFDGAGGFSTENTVSIGGQIIPRTKTGTYIVNANCTGSVAITGGVNFNFALGRGAKSMRFVVTTAGVAVMGTMEKQ